MSSRFVRNSFYGTLAAASTTLGSFFSGLIVARVIGVNGTGAYALAMWIVAVTTTVTGAGLPSSLVRYLPDLADDKQSTGPASLAALLLRPILAFSSLPLLIACLYAAWLVFRGGPPGSDSSLADPMVAVLIGLSCASQGLGDFIKAYLRGTHQLDQVARLTSVAALAQLAATVVGCLVFGVRGALAGYLVGAIIPMLPVGRFRGIRAEAAPDLRRRIARYTVFRWLSEIAAAFVFARIEVLFLQVFWGVGAVGLLTTSMTLANLAVQGPMMLTWGFLPHFTEQLRRDDRQALQESYETGTRIMGFMIFPACLGLAAIIPELLPLLYGQAFSAAVPSAMLLVCAASIGAVATVGSNLVWAMERSDVDLYLGSIGAVISTAGGLLVIAPLGVMGAAISRSLTQFAVIGLGMWFLASRIGFRPPFGALARLFAAALLCAVAARLCLSQIHGPAGIAVAIPVAAIVYVVGVRLIGGLEPSDIARIRKLAHILPLPAGGVAQRLVLRALR